MVVVVVAAIYLIVLAVISFFAPSLAVRFLDGFASSATVHLAEMALRFLVGWSLVVYSPQMLYFEAFSIFGWVLVITSVLLLLIPWRWHRRFAEVAVRPLTRHVWLFGVLSLSLGGVMLFAVFNPLSVWLTGIDEPGIGYRQGAIPQRIYCCRCRHHHFDS